METISISVNTEKFKIYQSKQSGQAVLFIHGNSLPAFIFQKQMSSKLGDNYRLISFDLPGHGNSKENPDPESNFTMKALKSYVLNLINALNIESLIIVGHSLGGHIAIEISERIKNLKGILVFGTPPLNIPPEMDKMFYVHEGSNILFKGEWTRDDLNTYANLLVHDKSIIEETFIDNIAKTDVKFRPVFGNSMMTGGYENEVQILKSSSIPLCIVHGEHDVWVKHTYFDKLDIPALWHNKVHIIKNSGHSPQYEQPERFNKILEEFIKDNQ